MSRRAEEPGPVPASRRAGCWRAALTAPALVLLAPAAAAVRLVRRWRRGGAERGRLGRSIVGGRCRLALTLDVPAATAAMTRLRLTDVVVRVAEALREPDDVYHLVWRPQPEEPAKLRAVGPLVQELGERVALELARPATAGHTLLWLVLPRARHLGGAVDPQNADPDAAGEPDGLVAACDPRWAAATAVAPRGPSQLLRLAVWIPESHAARVEPILRRMLEDT